MQAVEIQGKAQRTITWFLQTYSKPALQCDRQRPCSACKKRRSNRPCVYNDNDKDSDSNMYILIPMQSDDDNDLSRN
jgi:hypothetical protein